MDVTDRIPVDRAEPDRAEDRKAARLIAEHTVQEGAFARGLAQLEAAAWSEAVRIASIAADVLSGTFAALGHRGELFETVIDRALEDAVRSLVATGILPSVQSGQPESTLLGIPPYLFLSPVADWIRLLVARACVDEELRASGTSLDPCDAPLVRRLGRAVAVALLLEIARLPTLQRLSLTLSVWRSEHDEIKPTLIDLARAAQRTAPAELARAVAPEELFPLPIERSLNSDEEIAEWLKHRTGEEVRANNVAANRSVARRKLVGGRRHPEFAPLLSSLLPYKKDPPQWPPTGASKSLNERLAGVLQEAADRDGSAFGILLQGSCHRYQPLLPAYSRARRRSADRSIALDPWSAVRAHVSACARCRTIDEVMSDSSRAFDHARRNAPLARRDAFAVGTLSLDPHIERIATSMIQGSDDERLQCDLIHGLGLQPELQTPTLELLATVAAGDGDVAERACEALERQCTLNRYALSADDAGSVALPIELRAGPRRRDPLGVFLSGPGDVWGRLRAWSSGRVQLHLAGLPGSLDRQAPLLRFYGNPDGGAPQQLAVPAANAHVKHGAVTIEWDPRQFAPHLLRSIQRVVVLRPEMSRTQRIKASRRLERDSKDAHEHGRLLEALNLCRHELILREALEQEKARRDEAPDRFKAIAARRAGALCIELGRLDEATEHLRAALEQAKQHGWRRVQCDALRGLGEVAAARAEWNEAEVRFAAALRQVDRLEPANDGERLPRDLEDERRRRTATVFTARGRMRVDKGLVRRGRADLRRAARLFSDSNDEDGQAAALNALALALRAEGRYEEALKSCRDAHAALDRRDARDAREGNDGGTRSAQQVVRQAERLRAELLCTEGRLHHAMGNAYTAMGLFERSLAQMYRIGHRRGEGDALNAIGRVYLALGDVGAAIGCFLRAKAIFVEIHDGERLAAVVGMLARAHLVLAQASTAARRRQLLELALAEAEESLGSRTTDWGRAITHNLKANIHRAIGEARLERREEAAADAAFIDAEREYEIALDLRVRCGDRRGLALTQMDYAAYELARDEAETAEQRLREAVAYFRERPSSRAAADAWAQYAAALARLDRCDEAVLARCQAVAHVEEARRDIDDRELRRRYFATGAWQHRELARLLAPRKGAEHADAPERTVASLLTADAARGRILLDRSAGADGLLVFDREHEHHWRAGVAAVTRHDVAALSYLLTPTRCLVVVVREGVATTFDLETSSDELRRQTYALLRALAAGGRCLPHQQRLYRQLIAPAAAALEGVTELIVCPDEAIAGLPFELLIPADKAIADTPRPWSDPTRRLLDRYVVSYVPALSLLAVPEVRSKLPVVLQPAALAPALRLEGPDDRLACHLPEDGWRGARLWIGGAASAKEARSALRGGAIDQLLVVADGLFESPPRPLPVPSAIILGDGEGWTIEAIAAEHRAPELVVLAVDGAANGPFELGEGTRSLAWAFLSAGARAVIAPTLPVLPMSGLVRRLLRHLNAGAAPAAALRSAQLETSEVHPHPAHWAGWRLLTTRCDAGG